jgi:NAD(P)-dependent dehydrogenase (short-subunit alcohol dehydrogenase family)
VIAAVLTDTHLVSPENRLPGSTAHAHLPIPRLARPVEIANFIVYLLGNEASFQTGGVYTIDGGALQV